MATISEFSPPAVSQRDTPASVHRFSAALSDLIRIIQFRDRDRACCYDVTVSQCYALEAVAESGALTVNELASRLVLDKSTASRLAAGLVESGYLERTRHPEDGRVVLLELTEAGRSIHSRIVGDLAEEYGAILSGLSPDACSAVVQVVERLRDSFAARVDTSGGSCCSIDTHRS